MFTLNNSEDCQSYLSLGMRVALATGVTGASVVVLSGSFESLLPDR